MVVVARVHRLCLSIHTWSAGMVGAPLSPVVNSSENQAPLFVHIHTFVVNDIHCTVGRMFVIWAIFSFNYPIYGLANHQCLHVCVYV